MRRREIRTTEVATSRPDYRPASAEGVPSWPALDGDDTVLLVPFFQQPGRGIGAIDHAHEAGAWEVANMTEDRHAVLSRQLDRLLSSKQAALLPGNLFDDVKNICSESQAAADNGDFERANRLLHFAANMLKAEREFSGWE
jgi:hypothetical protein